MDRRSVVNPQQARAPLAAVRAQQPSGPRLVAFFAVMYYAGLRPEEAINLSADDIVLPLQTRNTEQDDDDWGELHLRLPRPTQAATGPMTAARASGGSSSTVLRATAGSCRLIRN
jgi:hypothetical protein